MVPLKDLLNVGGGGVSRLNLNNFGGRAKQETALTEIRILRDDHEVVFAGIIPDYLVDRAGGAAIFVGCLRFIKELL